MAQRRLAIDEGLAAYLDGLLAVPPAIERRTAAMADHPRAMMMTHPDLGRLLAVLVRASGGSRVVEVGTFVGISAAWIASALAPGGRLDTLEIDPEVARETETWLADAGFADRVSVHPGDAHATLRDLPGGAYDLAYIDADKTGYLGYLEEAIRLVRPGGLILADNVLAGGDVVGGTGDGTQALRRYSRTATHDKRLDTAILTIGDGVALSVVL